VGVVMTHSRDWFGFGSNSPSTVGNHRSSQVLVKDEVLREAVRNEDKLLLEAIRRLQELEQAVTSPHEAQRTDEKAVA
jgi:hypothetical protein